MSSPASVPRCPAAPAVPHEGRTAPRIHSVVDQPVAEYPTSQSSCKKPTGTHRTSPPPSTETNTCRRPLPTPRQRNRRRRKNGAPGGEPSPAASPFSPNDSLRARSPQSDEHGSGEAYAPHAQRHRSENRRPDDDSASPPRFPAPIRQTDETDDKYARMRIPVARGKEVFPTMPGRSPPPLRKGIRPPPETPQEHRPLSDCDRSSLTHFRERLPTTALPFRKAPSGGPP